ncbi:hypothetical protein U0070_016341, partial [Myodes glareolus]
MLFWKLLGQLVGQLVGQLSNLLGLGSMTPGTKIKDLESQTPSGQHPLPVSGPVMLIALPPPAKDYLCLSITSFCFCILLAIPALMFSLKTREANYDGDWRRAQRNSRLALGFSVSSILVGCILMISSVTILTLDISYCLCGGNNAKSNKDFEEVSTFPFTCCMCPGAPSESGHLSTTVLGSTLRQMDEACLFTEDCKGKMGVVSVFSTLLCSVTRSHSRTEGFSLMVPEGKSLAWLGKHSIEEQEAIIFFSLLKKW